MKPNKAESEAISKRLTPAMDNVHAWKLGEICREAAKSDKIGDPIDLGLILRRRLEEAGYAIVQTQGGEA